MFSVQSVLGFILGFAAAVFVLILCAPIIWRRALFLAQKVVRTELPLSLKEVEADRDFLRARHAVIVCRLQEELAQERREDYARKLALSQARERLQQIDAMAAQDKARRAELEKRDKKIAGLEETCRNLQEKADKALPLKKADLAEFRRQIKIIAAQTAGFIAAEEGENSPVLHFVAPAEEAETAKAAAAAGGKPGRRAALRTVKAGDKPALAKNLAAAIYEQAQLVAAKSPVKTANSGEEKETSALLPAAANILPVAKAEGEAQPPAAAKPAGSKIKNSKKKAGFSDTAKIAKTRSRLKAETAGSRENS
ncbi:hypothetical protein [Candidatus Tokpelaia sp.]|uniref:hypothetical protein n=1 Tax=Candidatus Tokpelaia sp. TaxID=2233777 RepID=UPI00123B3022|nr:hypothetical protein [Candidatus Tokpelaia sp.]KAA6405826.1 hypothetical protein DPQ22_02315 [Candidatus Tokpelaia sp.]